MEHHQGTSWFQLAEKLGYVSHDHELGFIHPTSFRKVDWKEPYKKTYGHHDVNQHAVFGLGYYANPIIPFTLDYRIVSKDNIENHFLKEFNNDPEKFVSVGDSFDPLFRKVKYITIHAAHSGIIDFREYEKEFGSSIKDDFNYALAALKDLGVLKLRDYTIEFKKMTELELFPYMLFFVGIDKVREAL